MTASIDRQTLQLSALSISSLIAVLKECPSMTMHIQHCSLSQWYLFIGYTWPSRSNLHS